MFEILYREFMRVIQLVYLAVSYNYKGRIAVRSEIYVQNKILKML